MQKTSKTLYVKAAGLVRVSSINPNAAFEYQFVNATVLNGRSIS